MKFTNSQFEKIMQEIPRKHKIVARKKCSNCHLRFGGKCRDCKCKTPARGTSGQVVPKLAAV